MIALQETSRSPSLHDQSHLPAKVHGILYARIHTLCAQRRLNVSGIPGKQNALMDIAANHAAMDLVSGEPTGVGSPRPSRPTEVNHTLNLLARHLAHRHL